MLWTIATAIALLLAACSNNASRREDDLAALRQALPGIYANTAETGLPASSASDVRLSITPIIAQSIGDPVFFVRESAAGNEHLVLAQYIWTLALDPQGQIVQRMYLFKDPRRWVGVAEHQDLLLALLPDDLTLLAGCNLIWNRSATGFQTQPVGAADACLPGASAQGQWLARALELHGAQLALSERQVGPEGALSSSAGVTDLTLQRRGGAGDAARDTRPRH